MLADERADAIYIEAHINAIGHGLLMVVFHNQVLIEEPEGLLGRSGGQPNDKSVEILQHLSPQVVDGAVTLVGHDEVEGLNGEDGVVGDRGWILLKQRGH